MITHPKTILRWCWHRSGHNIDDGEDKHETDGNKARCEHIEVDVQRYNGKRRR